MMKQNLRLSISTIVIASVCALVIAELFSRALLDPVDYLLPNLIADPVLGHKIAPKSGGHDELGFRNVEVPEQADVVVIGDSQTYGVSASARNSWPAQLSKNKLLTTYNLSLGGYGPAEYLYLLETYALRFKPKVVVVAVYFGNDLIDTFKSVYTFKHWSAFREQNVSFDLAIESIDNPARNKPLRSLRTWLAKHSMVYRILTRSSLFDSARVNELQKLNNGIMSVCGNNRCTYFAPETRIRAVKLSDKRVMHGLELSKTLIARIRDTCANARVRLIVALIPTKESVYAHQIRESPDMNVIIGELLSFEQEARTDVIAFLMKEKIAFVDLLPALQLEAASFDIYPVYDGHPNAKGYSLIASEIGNHI